MKILVAYDGSNSAMQALRTAVTFAKAFEAKIFVVTSFYGENENSVQEITKSENLLKDAESFVLNEGIACEQHMLMRAMRPGEDIIQFAKENKIDQIIIGTKRRSKIGKLVFGSNAQYIILNAPCPVTTVK